MSGVDEQTVDTGVVSRFDRGSTRRDEFASWSIVCLVVGAVTSGNGSLSTVAVAIALVLGAVAVVQAGRPRGVVAIALALIVGWLVYGLIVQSLPSATNVSQIRHWASTEGRVLVAFATIAIAGTFNSLPTVVRTLRRCVYIVLVSIAVTLPPFLAHVHVPGFVIRDKSLFVALTSSHHVTGFLSGIVLLLLLALPNLIAKRIRISGILIVTLAVAACGSRSALVGLVAGAAAVAFIRLPMRRALLLLGTGAVVLLLTANMVPRFRDTFEILGSDDFRANARESFEVGTADHARGLSSSQVEANMLVRFAFWGSTLDVIRDSPLIGVGAYRWNDVPERYVGHRGIAYLMVDGERDFTDAQPHNMYLYLLVETGAVGTLAFLSPYALAMWSMRRRGTRDDVVIDKSAVRQLAAAAVGTLSFGLAVGLVSASLMTSGMALLANAVIFMSARAVVLLREGGPSPFTTDAGLGGDDADDDVEDRGPVEASEPDVDGDIAGEHELATAQVLAGDLRSRDTMVAIAIAFGLAAALSGASPTGYALVDVVEVAVVAGLVTWFGARAPWWVLVAAAGAASAFALAPLPLVIGIIGFAVAAWISPLDEHLPARAFGGAVSAGLTVNSLIRSELGNSLVTPVVVGCTVAGGLALAGLIRSSRRERRIVAVGALGVLVFIAIASAGMLLASRHSVDDVRRASVAARSGYREAKALRPDAASDDLHQAAGLMRSVEERVGAWWTSPATLVPVLAQHRAVAVDVGGEMATQLDRSARDLGEIQLEDLRVTNGRVDIDAVSSLAPALGRLNARLASLSETVAGAQSVWLVDPVGERLQTVASDLASFETSLDSAIDSVTVAPQLLGSDGPRRYLLLFTTPSEARGLGGFIGNYAVVEIDDGRLTIAESGRRSELEAAADDAGATLTEPAGMLATYGKFGLVGKDGTVGPRSWSNLTMEPDWPSFAQAASDLFAQSGHEPVDGVMVMDPYVLQKLVTYSGPIGRPGGGRLGGKSLADYLLLEQYLAGNNPTERTDALAQIATEVVTRLFGSDLPNPTKLAADMKPFARQQRLLFWLTDPEEQAAVEWLGLGHGLPELGRADGFSLALTNAGASKIDRFLKRDIELDRIDVGGEPFVEARVTLTNNAPTSGMPDYVVGNSVGLPEGSSRLYLSAYTSDTVESAEVDGEPAGVERGTDAGWHTAAHYVTLAPGQTRVVTYHFPAHSIGEIVTRVQPLATR